MRKFETSHALLETLAGVNIQLTVSGDKLGIDAPKGVLTDDIRQAIRQHKAELLALLRQAEVSPGPGEPAAARPHSCEPGKATGEGQPAPCPKCGSLEWVPHGHPPEAAQCLVPAQCRHAGLCSRCHIRLAAGTEAQRGRQTPCPVWGYGATAGCELPRHCRTMRTEKR